MGAERVAACRGVSIEGEVRAGELRVAAAARAVGAARGQISLFSTASPVFFFSRVIKSRVSGVGARVGRGERRGVSRW